ncbi:tumor necrosis factor receptor superfamily member 11B-like [Mustelus asterias]
MIQISLCNFMLFIISFISVPLVSQQYRHTKLESFTVPVYLQWDEQLAQYHTCEKCPPGTYRKTHCNAEKRTECAPCPDSHYTEYWNYLGECQYCNVFCKEYQYIKYECNSTHNRICECVEGHHYEFEFCLKHYKCPPGFGVETLGTPYTNTVCMKCRKGFFSRNSSANQPCQRHTNCTAFGLKQMLQGDAFHDNVCQPCHNKDASGIECSDLPIKKEIALCDQAIFKFIARQKLTSEQLRILLEHLPGKKTDTQHLGGAERTSSGHAQTFHLLKQWKIENIHLDTVKGLMRGLKEANIRNVYKKLLRKLQINRGAERFSESAPINTQSSTTYGQQLKGPFTSAILKDHQEGWRPGRLPRRKIMLQEEKARVFNVVDAVMARNFAAGSIQVASKVVERTRPVSSVVKVQSCQLRKHVDHLRRRAILDNEMHR